MLTVPTLLSSLFISASLFAYAGNHTPEAKGQEASSVSTKRASHVNYTFQIDNAINKNNTVDSVLVILDKFDRTGAGVVRKVFHPDNNNQVVIADLPSGKYYAEVYILGLYRKHFSTVIHTEKNKKNKVNLSLDYNDVYTPGNAKIPAEDTRMFAYNKN